MIFELMNTGHLDHWYLYFAFVACCLILVLGSAALGLAWKLGAFKRRAK